MYNYKTIYISDGAGVNYSFDVELNQKVVYNVSRRGEYDDVWDRTDLAQVPDRVQIELYKRILRAVAQLKGLA
jgi:hypothetical protein